MTTQQLHLFNALSLVVLIVVAVLTRATARRIAGALAGAAVGGVVALAIIALTLMWIDFALCGFIFLITWRIARRFGWRGLAVAVIAAAIIGPPRDYWYMAKFPEWGSYAPGIAPVLAISATYVILGVLGHGVMRLVAGQACEDRLARRPWESAEPSAADERSRHPGSQ
jgi:hypothetical protein